MKPKNPFTIYDASAGSGKTYTLVKAYLKIVLQSSFNDSFKNILAITFTNKAVAEMKERILEMLTQFSSKEMLLNPNSMFSDLVQELSIEPVELQKKSKYVLDNILYNYAAFDVSTIDGFMHKIIRTFAYDLKMPLNFEVELDTDSLLQEAVDSLIEKAGSDTILTKVLVDFAIEKTDADKSWDIAFDFNKIAKLLVRENDIFFIDKLKDKSLADFSALKKQLKKDINLLESQIVDLAQNTLQLITNSGLQFNDFSGGYLPKHFNNLANKKLDISFTSSWQIKLLENESLYPKRVSPEIASIIDGIQADLIRAFTASQKLVFHFKFLKAFYKNTTPLSVLNAINKELEFIKEDQNKILISEFNTIINNEIKKQPTPFIYERLGEKFKHYFIDEFQDTSKLQWGNLKPLIENSLLAENLKQEQGTAMLVGDAKQAIYRWRGGEAEQFINLYTKKAQPFPIEQFVDNLPTNYRSLEEIIKFNNAFFKQVSTMVFSNADYKNLYYQGANQNTFKTEEGYVQLDFLVLKDQERDVVFPEKVLENIKFCQENNFQYKDICVLVRKKDQGVAIAQFLHAAGVPIISSETMLIFKSTTVQFINHVLQLLVQPNNEEIKILVLNFLVKKFQVEDKHAFFSKLVKKPLFQIFKALESYNIYINPNKLIQLPLYELVETIVQNFALVKKPNAYVQFYLDFVLTYSQKQGSNLLGFLEHAEAKKESLSIVAPLEQNAVQIMTIHKSKGLEFPVVIFPYADLNIYKEVEPKEWFPLQAENYQGFTCTLLNYNKKFGEYGEVGQQIYETHEAALELDNINLLYVACTRAVEQLFIVSNENLTKTKKEKPQTYAELFNAYLKANNQWEENKKSYAFGNPLKKLKDKGTTKKLLKQDTFISTSKESHNIKIVTKSGCLWNTDQEKAIEKGNLVHDIMSQINTKEDISFAIGNFLEKDIINQKQAESLKATIIQIVEHSELKKYFSLKNTIYNERDILSKNNSIIRPDRLVINSKNEAVIIDYKTGNPSQKHKNQLENYKTVIEEMPIQVSKKILVYINEEIKVQTF